MFEAFKEWALEADQLDENQQRLAAVLKLDAEIASLQAQDDMHRGIDRRPLKV